MVTNKHGIAVTAALLGAVIAHAVEAQELPQAGRFLGYGTVASITSTAGDPCPVSQGDSFTGVLQIPGLHGKGAIFRLPVTLPSGMVAQENVFPKTFKANVPISGSFQFGIAGSGALAMGHYQAEFSPLDAESFAGTLTIVYQNPAGVSGDICTETDQLVFIRTSASVSDHPAFE
jgi:hypothetical protein